MPLDEFRPADDLTASEELSRIEIQNRYGMKSLRIPQLVPDKFTTVLLVETEKEIAEAEYYRIYDYLKQNHGITAMQTAFTVKNLEEPGYDSDLHLSAHLRFKAMGLPISPRGKRPMRSQVADVLSHFAPSIKCGPSKAARVDQHEAEPLR